AVPSALANELRSEGLDTKVLVFTSRLEGITASKNMIAAAAAAWPLDALNQEYAKFLSVFRDVDDTTLSALSASATFALRALLIHEYRRILLKDPHLPLPLLPERWNGSDAISLSARIYRQIASTSDDYVDHLMAEGEEQPPVLSAEYWDRFGGLR
ncbi:MAG: hypothetical protein HKN05_01250, partial [Rhizobiales bacterium]|nr:hypothetical protein [Hyphomicrobiales bacterium]